MLRLRVTELAEDIGVSERDIIDIAHDAGVELFEMDGFELSYDDFDRPTPMFSSRGYNPAAGLIDLESVELLIDDPAIDRFQYLTGTTIR